MRIHWIGHATTVLDVGGVRLLTDPLLRRHAGLLRRVGPKPEPAQWAGVDAILLSHLHLDHADVGSLRMLPDVPVLTGPADAAWVERVGHPAVALASTGEWTTLHGGAGTVEVRLVRADHHSRPMPHRPNDAHGFLVRSAWGEVVWFPGDTSAYPELDDLPHLAGGPIDVALLPIHGWGPRLSPGHMDPMAAAHVCDVVKPAAVVPIHHGTFHPVGLGLGSLDWMQRPLLEFRAALHQVKPPTDLLDVGLGETIVV